MNILNLVAIGLVLGVSLVAGASRYIAIPIDEIDIIEVNPVVPPQGPRYPRQAETYAPAHLMIPSVHREDPENASPRIARSDAHVLDYVDFGAHTGNNGAYSWYADYPAHH